MAGIIKNITDILAQITDAIRIGGAPTVINATEHKQTLDDIAESYQNRLQKVVTDDLGDDIVDWKAAGSRGIHLFPLVNDNFEIDSFSNPVKGDTIYLNIHNDFAFSFSTAFENDNVIIGTYVQQASGDNIVRVNCVNDDLGSELFIVEFLNGTGGGAVFPYTDKDATTTNRVLKTKTIEIGVWDMDAVGVMVIAHTIPSGFTKIMNMVITIWDDTANAYPVYYNFDAAETDPVQARYFWNNTNVQINRVASGLFDSANFNNVTVNRGTIFIQYID